MKKLNVSTKSGTVLNGVLFPATETDTVVIAITGVHGNFYSNPFYYTIGDTLSIAGIDFIYAQTRDAFGQMEIVNVKTGNTEIIGSWNEDFTKADEDIGAYIDYAAQMGYKNIILAGHSLGANKVIYYLSKHADKRVSKFILLSPANIRYLTSQVSDQEKSIIAQFRETGRGQELLPFDFIGWLPCVADTAWQWLYADTLNNVHVEADRDFSQVESIKHSGALIIGTYDRFTYGNPCRFLSNINDHMPTASDNELIFIEGTGHTYQHKERELSDSILKLVSGWIAETTKRG
ncbi:alpha/beta fold hydrolase (plasmid) [Klebsiella pneumoniae]|uniref:alpha/beta fold hydrolase n=1 Tax=Klebsiella pneumoniae TaxID=573 RepID=UPI0012977C1C|nr:alpha/beta fold hydrolase [Klebsiella pneumoniae]QGA58904.1 alpha/beta fold hydrolase [Klebsiella pneumoniae]